MCEELKLLASLTLFKFIIWEKLISVNFDQEFEFGIPICP